MGGNTEQRLRLAREALVKRREKHEKLKERLLGSLEGDVTLENVAGLRGKWEECVGKFKEFEKVNKDVVNGISDVTVEYTKLNMLQKYLRCATILEEAAEEVSIAFDKEKSIWNTFGGASKKSYKKWILGSSEVFDDLENAMSRFSRVHRALVRISAGPLHIVEYANKKITVFKERLLHILEERMGIFTKFFEWPIPNHKMTESISPLQFASNVNHSDVMWDINCISRGKWEVTDLDERMEPFICLFVHGIRLQQAIDPQWSEGNIWSLDILFSPLFSRFRFHFMEESATNKFEKPEWCFSFIGNTISDHAEFLLIHIQPWINRESKSTRIPDAKNILIRQLIALLEVKLLRDIPVLLGRKKQHMYCHTLTECVKLEKLLFEVHNYPPGSRSPMQAFAYNEELLNAWIKIEFYVFEKQLSRILNSKQKWDYQFESMPDIDELKPTYSAESIIVMTESLSERYGRLLDPVDKMRIFEEIQQEAILSYCSEMKMFFTALAETSEILTPSLLRNLARISNSANYLSLVLNDWSEQIQFLEMQYERELILKSDVEQENFHLEDVEGSLFQTPIRKCDKILTKSLKGLSSAISRSFHTRSEAYFNEKKRGNTDTIAYDVSPNICTALFELNESIGIAIEELAPMLLDKFWSLFVDNLDAIVSDDILNGRSTYTHNSAEQLRFNMKVLFSSITPHYQSDSTIFPKTKDCIHVLVMEKADVKQLYEDLHLMNAAEQQKVLQEYRVFVLTGRETELLLRKRRDLTT